MDLRMQSWKQWNFGTVKEIMSTLAKGVAKLVRGPVQKWKAYWDVDHVKADFMSLETLVNDIADKKANNRELKRSDMMNYAKKHVFSRFALAEGFKPVLLPVDTAAEENQVQTGFNNVNRQIFFGGIAFAPFLFVIIVSVFLALHLKDRPPTPKTRSTYVLDKRLKELEEKITAPSTELTSMDTAIASEQEVKMQDLIKQYELLREEIGKIHEEMQSLKKFKEMQ